MAVNTSLIEMRRSVRRYTHKPDPSNMSDEYIDQKINYFGLYILPELVKLMPLRKVLTFYTSPNVDTYTTITDPLQTTNPLYDFKNRYVNIHPPVFFAGIQGAYYQDRSSFYADWPQFNSVANIGQAGNNVQRTFVGNAQAYPMLQNSVVFTTVDSLNNAMVLVDYPLAGSPNVGILGPVNQPQINPALYGSINYVTGAFTIIFDAATFSSPPGASAPIYIENVTYTAAKPFAMLFYDNSFIIRPVPDKTYVVEINVDALPTELLATGQSPDINMWFDVFALGAAKLVFRDDFDTESMQALEPIFQQALDLANRPTLNNSANVRTPSFYARRSTNGAWFFGNNWNNFI